MSHYRVRRSESDLKSRGGSTDLLLMDFMVRIHVTINRTLNSTEEDFTHRLVFPPLPPPLRFSREHLLPSLRSSSSITENFARRIWSPFFPFLGNLVDWPIDRFFFKVNERYFKKKKKKQPKLTFLVIHIHYSLVPPDWKLNFPQSGTKISFAYCGSSLLDILFGITASWNFRKTFSRSTERLIHSVSMEIWSKNNPSAVFHAFRFARVPDLA